ncbi:hypothetical protein GL213_11960 [Halogeometricum borinquense]|uniref:DUF7312 domain-containing protein n=1 Tax=Halogeometricum borinquense TaxID=60847 RepID=A0A6C0UE14_9EURY|nr:hypothetical protein [Halogeometricum borinquense]QIB73420.1 hypothetical protein G3I44_03450 [Halogeometricum borinquense]QIQ77179.1 hypothetical protein GL213_11960 [Halogeometricum borinquense]
MDTRDDVENRRDDPSDSNRPDSAGGRSEPDGVTVEDALEDERPELGPLEPGTPTAENVLFVILGALATVLLFVTAF